MWDAHIHEQCRGSIPEGMQQNTETTPPPPPPTFGWFNHPWVVGLHTDWSLGPSWSSKIINTEKNKSLTMACAPASSFSKLSIPKHTHTHTYTYVHTHTYTQDRRKLGTHTAYGWSTAWTVEHVKASAQQGRTNSRGTAVRSKQDHADWTHASKNPHSSTVLWEQIPRWYQCIVVHRPNEHGRRLHRIRIQKPEQFYPYSTMHLNVNSLGIKDIIAHHYSIPTHAHDVYSATFKNLSQPCCH